MVEGPVMVHGFGAVLIAFLVDAGAATVVQASVDPGTQCKEKKAKATGKASLDLMKTFSKNAKKPNVTQFGHDLSKARSKFSKAFTSAEFTSSGQSRNCETGDDATLIFDQVWELACKIIGGLKPGPQKPLVLGPQSPRDIGANAVNGNNLVQLPDDGNPLVLCNVHFHNPPEHSGYTPCPAPNPANPARDGQLGVCPGDSNRNRVGDEVEFHWVYTSCLPEERTTTTADALKHCVCTRPRLPFTLGLLDLGDFDDYNLVVSTQVYVIARNGTIGADAAPTEPQLPVPFKYYWGSTTGPDYSNAPMKHSKFKVLWELNPACDALEIGGLQAWCANPNLAEKDKHDHGIRPLVVAPGSLSPWP
jgi:hypothetical protein